MTQPSNNPEPNTTYRVDLHPAETPSEAVVRAVAELTDQAPLELQPLAEVIDPVALDAYITAAEKGSSVTATLDYCGYHVLVTPSEIKLEP